MYLYCNIEVRSVDHCCSGEVLSITLPVCVCAFVALGIRHAMRMHHIFIYGLPLSTIFCYSVSQKARFSGEKKAIEHTCKMRVSSFCTNLMWNIFHSKKKWANCDRKGILLYLYSCPILMKLEICQQIFGKSSDINFHEYPSSGSQVALCARTDRHDEANSCSSQFCERA
jgi:hypothetical protein